MANSIPVQTGPTTIDPTAAVVTAPAGAGFAEAFAALLAGLVQQTGETLPAEAPKTADLAAPPGDPPKDGPPEKLPAADVNVKPVVLIGMLMGAPAAKPTDDKSPVRGKSRSDSDSVLDGQSPNDQVVTAIVPTAADLPSPVPPVVSDQTPALPLAQSSSSSSSLSASQASSPSKTSGVIIPGPAKVGEAIHRPAPTSPRGEKPTSPEASTPAAQVSEPKAEKIEAVTEKLPDLTMSSLRSDISPVVMPPLSRLSESPAPTGENRASPVDQVSPVLVGMLKSADGTQSITIRLQPDELGHVQIRIDRANDGTAHVGIIAERPETLQLLQRDQPRLEQALDQAGVSSNGRTVSFQAVPDQVGASASRPDSMAAGSGGFSQGQSGGAWRESSDMRRDPQDSPDFGPEQPRARWVRVGLDITA